MALINVSSPLTADANEGRIVSNPERMGNRRWGQKVFLSGTEQPIEVALNGAFNGLGMIETLALQGRVFICSDADENDRVTGQTSFANTTPTWLLNIPSGTTAIPLYVNLTQAGTVAGGDVSIRIAVDNALRFSSGGTIETVYNPRTSSGLINLCTLYSGATATNAYGIRLFSAVTAADVSPAEGAVQGPYWQAELPYFLEGPGAFLVYTDAGTTGPTWEWSIAWAEVPTSELPRFNE